MHRLKVRTHICRRGLTQWLPFTRPAPFVKSQSKIESKTRERDRDWGEQRNHCTDCMETMLDYANLQDIN